MVESVPEWSRFRIVPAATYLGFVMGLEGSTRSWAAPLEKWVTRAASIGSAGAPAGVASHMYTTTAVPVLGYVAQLMVSPPQLEELERRAVSKVLCLPGNTLGRRWHLDLAEAGGARMGSVLAYVTACRVRAGIATVPDWSRDIEILRAAVQSRGVLADLANSDEVPGWWDGPPLAVNLRNAARAACDVGDVHDALRGDFEAVFESATPQARAVQVMTRALVPNVVGAAVARRLGVVCSALSARQRDAAWTEWAPTMQAVGEYAAQVFMRLPLNAWTTDARLHPSGGVTACRFGCPGRADDLRHYIRCARAWPPTFRALNILVPSTWPAHLALEGPTAQRIAAVRAWIAVFRAYSILRHDPGATVAAAIAAGADHARLRLPPGTGEGRARHRAHAQGPMMELRVPHLS